MFVGKACAAAHHFYLTNGRLLTCTPFAQSTTLGNPNTSPDSKNACPPAQCSGVKPADTSPGLTSAPPSSTRARHTPAKPAARPAKAITLQGSFAEDKMAPLRIWQRCGGCQALARLPLAACPTLL